jgi:formylglycine-generating enzyme required for sulfatase activity
MSWGDVGFAQTPRDPVVCVSYRDAKAYVAWLRRKTGKPYRLATDAEWEYAARAGTKTEYYWGNDADQACQHGNVPDQTWKQATDGSGEPLKCNDGHATTAPVGSFPANPFGLHDILGNVAEFVEGCYKDCKESMWRGGSWLQRPSASTPTYESIKEHHGHVGFRVALTY